MIRRAVIFVFIWLTLSTLCHTASAQLWLEPRCKTLPLTKVAPMAMLRDGRLATIDGPGIVISGDDGKTWSPPQKIYDGPAPGIPTADYSILYGARSGVLLVMYMDASTEKFGWDSAKMQTSADSRLDVWAVRSLDDGKTWIDRQKILDGYCGALIGMIQTKKGQIVAPLMDMVDRNRHAIVGCTSADDGRTWQRGNIIDLGGCGHHDGAMEPTVGELSDGRLLMLIRTNLDRFWEAYSDDGGRYWREIRPSKLDASSSPGYMIHLASGRLALFWNRLSLEGKSAIVPGGGPDFSDRNASWQREELSVAFSQDDGRTWTKPVVVARQRGAGLSYPQVLERRPGELWIITRFPTKSCFSLTEADFVR